MKKCIAFLASLLMLSTCASFPANAYVGRETGIDYDAYPELKGTLIIIGKNYKTFPDLGDYVSYLAIEGSICGENGEHVAEDLGTWTIPIQDDAYAVGDILASDKWWGGAETFPMLIGTNEGATITKVATCDEISASPKQIASDLIEHYSSWMPGLCATIEEYCNEDFVVNEDVLQYVDENNLTYDDYKRIAAEGLDNSDLAKGSDIVLGDVDGDGETSVLDVISVNRYILGKTDFSASQIKSADVDKSGIVDSADALLMMKKVVGIVEEF